MCACVFLCEYDLFVMLFRIVLFDKAPANKAMHVTMPPGCGSARGEDLNSRSQTEMLSRAAFQPA